MAALIFLAAPPLEAAQGDAPFPPFYHSAADFEQAILEAQSIMPLKTPVTGVTIPHHLLAADLMASTLALASGRQYERIIILSPDHFRRGKTLFSVAMRDFDTMFGPVSLDREGAEKLLANPLISSSNLFSHEHGVRAILPFIASYFPQTPVLPIALKGSSKQEDWDALAEALRPLVSDKTLIVQSTDFSHYLTWEEAKKRDRETLRVLLTGQEQELLKQPDHLDSRAAQYIQMKLQREIFGARPEVIANTNSSEYAPKGKTPPAETTSYIVQIYAANLTEALPPLRPGTEQHFFAGDFFTGRYVREFLENPESRERLIQRIRALTGGAPLTVNFEGVLSPQCPPLPGADESTLPPPQWRLCMPQDLTLNLMRDLNITAVSLANNHTGDYGPAAFEYTKNTLREHGITILKTALTDVDNTHPRRRHILSADNLKVLNSSPEKPLIAFIHWGEEGQSSPTERQKHLASLLPKNALIIGHHPHRAGKLELTEGGAVAWSLGNFLFDQPAPEANGTLLELKHFPQGTFWPRQIPVGNLYNFTVRGTL